MKKVRIGTLAVGLLAAAGLMLALGSSAVGQGGDGDVKKIAELVKKGDMAGAKKAAEAYAKTNEIEDIMNLFKPANKKGIGVTGSTKGIEQELIQLGRDGVTAAKMLKMADSYTEMGYHIAALGLIAEHKAPTKDAGKMTKKAWIESTTSMVETGVKFADAAKSKSAADVKSQAVKVNNSCNSCHTIFR